MSSAVSTSFDAVATAGPRSIVPSALVVLSVAISLVAYGSALIDDSYITFGAARELAEGRLANYNGDPIEQSSSPLHVLVLATTHRITGLALPIVGVALGIVFAAITIAATWWVSRRSGDSVRVAASASAIVAVSVPLTYWAVGGLEGPMVAAIVVIGVGALSLPDMPRSTPIAAVALCLLTFARPEGFIVVAVGLALTTAVRAWAGDARRVVPIWVSVLSFGATTAILRLVVTGHALPNTARAKARGLDVLRGVKYLATSLDRVSSLALALLLVAAGAAIVDAVRARDLRRSVIGAWAVTGLSLVVAAGGDWMPAGRFVLPWIPLLALLACSTTFGVRRVAPALLVLQLIGTGVFVATDSGGTLLGTSVTSSGRPPVPLVESRSIGVRRDLQTVPELVAIVDRIEETTGRTVTVSSGQAGISMFYLVGSGADVRFVDRFQLSTRDFDRCADLLRQNVFGALMEYGAWFAAEERCGVPAPDVVFEWGPSSAQPDLVGRYTVVFEQTAADISIDPTWGTGPFTHSQFVAVRNDLLDALG